MMFCPLITVNMPIIRTLKENCEQSESDTKSHGACYARHHFLDKVPNTINPIIRCR